MHQLLASPYLLHITGALMSSRHLPLVVFATVCCSILAGAAGAQSYPTRPVRVIVTFPPGAGSDITTRLVSAKLSETLSRQFVIDNRAGAAGNIGVEIAAHAAP